ncbi:MAG TPA: glycosyltransferase family 2 protein [Isosphaeraceae bacterium]|nr:glycosyltransferase family 2 protein [Isosphaeraceae bacterium]
MSRAIMAANLPRPDELQAASPSEPPRGRATIDVSILFPAYNEEAVIAEVIQQSDADLRDSGLRYELLVCDDGSTDRTWEILNELAGRLPELRLLRHEHNQGIMATLGDLYAAAEGQWIYNNSGDGQWRTADVLRMLPLTERHDIVVGRRRKKYYNWQRTVISGMFNILPAILFGTRTYDAGGCKVYPRKIIRELDRLISRGPFREAERLIRAAARGYTIGVTTVEFFPRRAGVARGAKLGLVGLSILDLVRCWWDIIVLRHK